MFKIDYNRDDRAWQIYEATTFARLFEPGQMLGPIVAHALEIDVPVRMHIEPKGHGWMIVFDGTLELRSFDTNKTEARISP